MLDMINLYDKPRKSLYKFTTFYPLKSTRIEDKVGRIVVKSRKLCLVDMISHFITILG